MESLIESIHSDNVELDGKIKEWLCWDNNEDTLEEIKKLILAKNYDHLQLLLSKRMEFGTAGLRAAMGAGYSKMNDLTIIQTSQGLCDYLIHEFPNIKDLGIVIGYDARHNSHRFAQRIAAVFLHAGIKTYLFSDIVPTPYVPFAILKYKCAAGVMVTASHNPKEDNGYKVYYSNGSQIIPPHDKGILSNIMKNLEPLPTSWDTKIQQTSNKCHDPLEDVHFDYMNSIQQHCHHKDNNAVSDLKITYTAMHGVGQRYEVDAFKAFSLKPFVPTKEQGEPDPDFPTVKYPNPEEGKGALTLAMKTAEANDSPFIIANDPDADRLAIAEKLATSEWKIFHGNEIATLLGWWVFTKYRNANPELSLNNVYMIYSTVSSHILKSIASIEGFHTIETLTGFKWMGNVGCKLKQEGKHVLFAFEEAIGFMVGIQVPDKDGISAGAIISEMASYLYKEGLTVAIKLEELYEKYGIHISNNSYVICHSQPTIKTIFNRIRTMENGSYPTSVGPFKVIAVRDLTEGFDSSFPDRKPVLPTSKSSEMITFTFEEGCVATMRTSGTEPKIKYYTEICLQPNAGVSREAAQYKINQLVHNLVEILLEPEKNDLQRRIEA